MYPTDNADLDGWRGRAEHVFCETCPGGDWDAVHNHPAPEAPGGLAWTAQAWRMCPRHAGNATGVSAPPQRVVGLGLGLGLGRS